MIRVFKKGTWCKINVCILTHRYDAPSGKFRKRFVGILFVELDRFRDKKWKTERVIVFNPLSSKTHKVLIIPRKFESAFCFDFTFRIVECLKSLIHDLIVGILTYTMTSIINTSFYHPSTLPPPPPNKISPQMCSQIFILLLNFYYTCSSYLSV